MRANGHVCRLKVEVDGRVLEPGAIKAKEAERLTAVTGYSFSGWEGYCSDGDPLAVRGLIWLVEHYRQGTNVAFKDVDIDDVDSIEGALVDERGRVLSLKVDEDGRPVVEKGKPVWLFDGEEDEDVSVPPVPQVPAVFQAA